MPLVIWLAAVVAWLLRIVESLVAAPMWIVAHAMPEGEGLAGDRGKQGYLLVLGVLVRPFLMLLGLIIAMELTETLGKLIGFLFTIYVAGWEAHSGAFIMPIHSTVAYVVILGAIMVITTHKLFGLITHLPDTILNWIGGHLPGLGEGQDEHRASMIIGGLSTRLENSMKGGAGIAMGGKAIGAEAGKQAQGRSAELSSATAAGGASGVSDTTKQLALGDRGSPGGGNPVT